MLWGLNRGRTTVIDPVAPANLAAELCENRTFTFEETS